MKWFRWHRGTCENPKFAVVAQRANKETNCGEGNRLCGAVSLTDVIAVWAVILEDAAKKEHWGKFKRTAAFVAAVLRWRTEEVQGIINEFIAEGMLGKDGGITNWKEYQYASDHDQTSAARQKRYYDKHKRKSNGTNALASRPDTDTDTEKIIPLARKKRPATSLPDGWAPSVVSTQKAQKLGLTPAEIGREADRFRNHARQNDRRCVMWDAAFDNWCIGAAERAGKPPQSAPNPQAFSALPGSPEFEAWRTYLRDGGKASLIRELDKRRLEGRAFAFDSRWPPGHKLSPEATI